MSAGNFTFIDRDKGYAKTIEALNELNDVSVTVGIHSDAGIHPDADGASIAEVGSWQEYGIGVPERSWLRSTFDDQENNLRNLMVKLATRVADEKGKFTAKDMVDIVGARFTGDIKKKMMGGIEPPLSQLTIYDRQQRGITGTTPLIATRVMITSITWKVRE